MEESNMKKYEEIVNHEGGVVIQRTKTKLKFLKPHKPKTIKINNMKQSKIKMGGRGNNRTHSQETRR